MKYLYAASIHGIQSFIFQTNKLKEIVGASALLDNVFSPRKGKASLFEQYCLKHGIDISELEVITKAAANFRAITTKMVGEKIVNGFPKYVAANVPGVLFTQVMIPFNEGKFNEAYQEAHILLQAQKNKSFMSLDPPFMGVRKSRRTGGAAVEIESGEFIDARTRAVLKFSFKDSLPFFKEFTGLEKVNERKLPLSFEEIVRAGAHGNEERKTWIAVVHADGNSIGKRVISLLRNQGGPQQFKKFSDALASATKKAVNETCNKVLEATKDENHFILRPIILGGDDITLVIRADKALEFVRSYLELFERYTKENLNLENDGLTACAGIAFIKHKFPFHYGVDLAEKLTKEAKKISKSIDESSPPSSVSIFKVQSSFIESLEEMRKRSYGASSSFSNEDWPLYVGPYFLHPVKENGKYPTLACLMSHVHTLFDSRSDEESQKALSKLRQYVELLKIQPERANLLLDRMKQVNEKFCMNLKIETKPSFLFDVLNIYSLI